MAIQKQLVEKQKIRELADVLAKMHAVADAAAKEFDDRGVNAMPIDGWPTMVRGLGYVYNLVVKLARPTDFEIHQLDVSSLELEGTTDRVLDAVQKAAEPPADYSLPSKKKSILARGSRKAKE